MDMNQYLEIFIDESKEHLQEMNQILLDLEKQPDNLELLDAIFRIAHTIKGMAGTMGYTKITNLTHKMENVMHEIRSGDVDVKEEIVDILFECFDALEEYVENLIMTGEEGSLDTDNLIKKLSMVLEGEPVEKIEEEVSQTGDVVSENIVKSNHEFTIKMDDMLKSVVNKAMMSDVNIFLIDVILDEKCMLKAARSFIVFNKLEDLGEIIASDPEAELIEDEKFDLNFQLLYLTKLDAKTLYNEIMNVSEINEVIIEAVEEKYDIASDDKVETLKDQSSTSQDTTTKTTKTNIRKNH